jgi:hypothetical protein
MLMAFHQIFISKSVQLLGLVLIDLEKKDQQKQKTKKQSKTKQKPRNKTTTKQFDHYFQNMSKSIFYITLRMLWHPRRVRRAKGNSRSPRN